MNNGKDHQRLEAELHAFIERSEERSSRRDEAEKAYAEVIANIEARLAGIEKEAARAPSKATLWAPAIGTISAVGALLWLVLTLRVNPLDGDVHQHGLDIRELSSLFGAVQAEDRAQNKEIEWHKEWIISLQNAMQRQDQAISDLRVKVAKEHD
jgi:hypothetical protein